MPADLLPALGACLLDDRELRRGFLRPDAVDLTAATDPFADAFAAGAHPEAS